MTIQQIKTFVVTGTFLNYHKASEELYITQPAITKQIRSLENELGFPLFVRSKKGIAFTPAGEVFFQFAKNMSESLEETMKRCFQAQLHNTIGICSEVSIRSARISEVIPKFITQYPNLGIKYEFCDASDIINSIRTKAYDLYITHIDSIPLHIQELNMLKLEEKELGFLVKKGYMGIQEIPDDFSVYNGCTFIDPLSKPLYADDLTNDFDLPKENRIRLIKSMGISPVEFQEKPNWQSVIAAIKLGMGITLVDQDIGQEVKDECLWIKTGKKANIYALWYSYNHKEELKKLLDLITKK